MIQALRKLYGVHNTKYILNVVVELLTFQLPITEVPGSYIGPGTGYSEVFRGFRHSLKAI
jgi:hypothetical protein